MATNRARHLAPCEARAVSLPFAALRFFATAAAWPWFRLRNEDGVAPAVLGTASVRNKHGLRTVGMRERLT